MLKTKSIVTSCLAQSGLLIFYYLRRVTRPQLHFGYLLLSGSRNGRSPNDPQSVETPPSLGNELLSVQK